MDEDEDDDEDDCGGDPPKIRQLLCHISIVNWWWLGALQSQGKNKAVTSSSVMSRHVTSVV